MSIFKNKKLVIVIALAVIGVISFIAVKLRGSVSSTTPESDA